MSLPLISGKSIDINCGNTLVITIKITLSTHKKIHGKTVTEYNKTRQHEFKNIINIKLVTLSKPFLLFKQTAP